MVVKLAQGVNNVERQSEKLSGEMEDQLVECDQFIKQQTV